MAPRDLWTKEDLDMLVHKRDVEKKKFILIAAEMGRPEGSCWRRYVQIAGRRPRPATPRRVKPEHVPVHRELGIETFVHMQAVLFDPAGILGNKRRSGDLHTYRMPITLAKVLHETP